MYTPIYIYIYIHTHSSSRKPSGRFFFLFMVSVVDNIKRFVYGFRRWFSYLWFPSSQETILYMVSVVGCLMASVVAGKLCLWFPSLDFGGFCRRRRVQNFRTSRAIPCFFCVCFSDWFPSLVVYWFPLCVLMVSVTFLLWFRYVVYGFRRRIFGGFCRRKSIPNFITSRAIPRFLCF